MVKNGFDFCQTSLGNLQLANPLATLLILICKVKTAQCHALYKI